MTIDPLSLIQSITISSAWGPTYTIDLQSQSASSVDGEGLIKDLKPQVEIKWIGNQGTTAIAPWGKPGPSKWPQIKGIVTAAGIALGALLVYKVAKKLV